MKINSDKSTLLASLEVGINAKLKKNNVVNKEEVTSQEVTSPSKSRSFRDKVVVCNPPPREDFEDDYYEDEEDSILDSMYTPEYDLEEEEGLEGYSSYEEDTSLNYDFSDYYEDGEEDITYDDYSEEDKYIDEDEMYISYSSEEDNTYIEYPEEDEEVDYSDYEEEDEDEEVGYDYEEEEELGYSDYEEDEDIIYEEEDNSIEYDFSDYMTEEDEDNQVSEDSLEYDFSGYMVEDEDTDLGYSDNEDEDNDLNYLDNEDEDITIDLGYTENEDEDISEEGIDLFVNTANEELISDNTNQVETDKSLGRIEKSTIISKKEDNSPEIVADNPTIDSAIQFERGMTLLEFLRKNPKIRDIGDVSTYFSVDIIKTAIDNGTILKKKGKLII